MGAKRKDNFHLVNSDAIIFLNFFLIFEDIDFFVPLKTRVLKIVILLTEHPVGEEDFVDILNQTWTLVQRNTQFFHFTQRSPIEVCTANVSVRSINGETLCVNDSCVITTITKASIFPTLVKNVNNSGMLLYLRYAQR